MEMPVDLRAGIEELLEIKKRSGESQRGKRIPVIQEFIEQELGTDPAQVRYARQGSWVLTGSMRKEEN